MGVASSQRLQNTLCLIAQLEHEANRASVSPRAGSSSEGATPVAAGEGSCNSHVRQSGGLLLEPLPGTQEEWSNETSDQPEAVEPMGVCRTLQNGGNLYPERPPETRGLVCEGGPEGCLLHSPHRPWPPAIPEVHAGQGELPVHMPPLRPFLCPPHLYQSDETSDDPPEVMGGQDNYLYRRYADSGGDFRTGISTPRDPTGDIAIPGVYHQSREVTVHSNPGNRIPESGDQLTVNGAQPPGREAATDQRRGREAPLPATGVSKSPLPVHRETKRYCSGSSPCSSLLPPLAGQSEKRPCLRQPELREHDDSLPGSSGRADLVATAPPGVERQVPSQGSRTDSHLLGCLPTGMGSIVQGNIDRRSMVRAGEVMAHQLLGDATSLPGCSDVPEGPVRSLRAVAAGQHHGSGLHKQPGGDSIPTTGQSGKIPLDVGTTEGYNADSPTHTRHIQLCGRRGVQDN